ncbi:hypothetical protein [Halorussus sp. MSC15.2]|uniref:hypothetical protein n=1 Tax=Halorussus sp. MSC15.2 TaxID=2283638 RepID=UPI0013CF9DF8|nr:hypothetical protein [Halorussus sp. MSC15.2]NEU59020.1 hypothetical protein [Halorussus sp. MSC15.2]
MSDLLRTVSRFLNDHWVLKWFVAPILFMASVLFVLGLFVTTSLGEIGQLVGLYAAVSLAVVTLGLVLDWVARNVVGWNVFTSNRTRERQ